MKNKKTKNGQTSNNSDDETFSYLTDKKGMKKKKKTKHTKRQKKERRKMMMKKQKGKNFLNRVHAYLNKSHQLKREYVYGFHPSSNGGVIHHQTCRYTS
jgi:hypothetical protein